MLEAYLIPDNQTIKPITASKKWQGVSSLYSQKHNKYNLLHYLGLLPALTMMMLYTQIRVLSDKIDFYSKFRPKKWLFSGNYLPKSSKTQSEKIGIIGQFSIIKKAPSTDGALSNLLPMKLSSSHSSLADGALSFTLDRGTDEVYTPRW